MKLLVLSVLVAIAAAKCPNSCSGHGTCSTGDICTCYKEKTEMYHLTGDSNSDPGNSISGVNANEGDAWTGADCSLRTCPRGMSWNVAAEHHDCLTAACDGSAYGGVGAIIRYNVDDTPGAVMQSEDMTVYQWTQACADAGNTCTMPSAKIDIWGPEHSLYVGTVDADGNRYGKAGRYIRLNVVSDGTTGGWATTGAHSLQVNTVTIVGKVATNNILAGQICKQATTNAKAVMNACTAHATASCTGYVISGTFNAGTSITCTVASGTAGIFNTGDVNNVATSVAVAMADYVSAAEVASIWDGTKNTNEPSGGYLYFARDGYTQGQFNAAQWNPALKNTGATDHKDNVECSDAGVCDRSSGTCQCFDGYEGSACQRTECPNDCSGQGTCMPNTLFASNAGVRYSGAWDSGLHYGCQCDLGFRGSDCSLKECPSFADPMYSSTHSDNGNTVGRDCSGRGICDYSTGLCQCFSGYTGADCSDVLALE